MIVSDQRWITRLANASQRDQNAPRRSLVTHRVRPPARRGVSVGAICLAFCCITANVVAGDDIAENFASAGNASPRQDPSGFDWPFIRGPQYDGTSAEVGLADRWPDTGPPVLWTIPLGQGYSSFCAWDDSVATQFQTFAGQFVICLDAATGSELWRHRYGLPYDPVGVYPGPRATPTYAQGAIYFSTPRGVVGCLDARTGRKRWSVDLVKRFGTRGTDFGFACSPTVTDGMVILAVGGPGASMIALRAADGSVVWQAGDDSASYTPPYPISFRGQRLVLGYLQNALVCHDITTGERLWRYELSAGYDEHSAWPIYSEPDLWISSPFQGGSQLLRLTAQPERPVEHVRSSLTMSNDIFSSVLVDGAVFGFDLREAQAKTHRPSRGQFRCLDLASGEVLWSTGTSAPRRNGAATRTDSATRIGHATVIVADGKLILLNDTGELILARASKLRYEEFARASVLGGEICWTQPALSRGRLFVRNHNRAACVYLGEPQRLTPKARAQLLTVHDIPQSEYIDWAAKILGVEPEYAFDIPSRTWLWQWYLTSLVGIMGGSLAVAAAFAGCWHLAGQTRLSSHSIRWLTRSLIFVLGALGTTLISNWAHSFVFTWPVSIFIAFQATVGEMDGRAARHAGRRRWRAVLVLCGFVVSCVVYFLVCRRLSLVFEWVFLCGFVAALPLTLAGRYAFQGRRWSWLWETIATAAAFTAFFWFAAGVLWLRV